MVLSHTHIFKLGVHGLFPQKIARLVFEHVRETLLRSAADRARVPYKSTSSLQTADTS